MKSLKGMFTRSGRRRQIPRPHLIYLVSAAGAPNYGDEFIARSWLRFLAEHKPDAEVWLDCPHPGRATSLFYNDHPNLRTTNTLWELAARATGDDARELGSYVCEKVRLFGSPRVDIGIDILRNADTLHALGGGYINDIWPSNIGVIAGLVEAHRISSAPLFGTGLGFLPLRTGNLCYLEELVPSFDFIEARDSSSASDLNIPLGCDDAFLGLTTNRHSLEDSDAPELMILIQGDFFRDVDDSWVTQSILDFVSHNSQSGQTRVGFVEAIPGRDRRYFGMLSSQFDNATFISFKRLWTHGIPFRQGQKWLTSRFHLHLLAAAAGCPGVAISPDKNYYSIKHGSLTALGTGWPVVSYSSTSEKIHLPAPTVDQTFREKSYLMATKKLNLAQSLYS